MPTNSPSAPRRVAPSRRWSGLASALVASVLLVLGSCGDDDSDSESTSSSITIEEERSYSFDDSDYDWMSPGPVARIRLEINDFHQGDLLITIYDALGRIILSKLYWTFDWVWYIDGEFSDIDFTEAGEPGLWTILLEYSEFTGDVTLVVETTEDVPEEPEVPPPTSTSDLLDPSYGEDGRATYALETAGGRRVVVDPIGRTVICGSRIDANGERRLGVWRFSGDGTLDSAFGEGGLFTLPNSSETSASGGFDVALDMDAGILVSGWVAGDDRRTDLALVRLTDDGVLDAGFGSAGLSRLDLGEDELGASIALDGTGRIYVAGAARVADDASGRLVLARFLGTGPPDAAFGDGGVVQPTSDPTDRGLDVALQSDGLPVVLGSRGDAMALWRFSDDGALDTTFGTGGVVTSPGAAGEKRLGRALAVASDDSLAVAGLKVMEIEGSFAEALVWRTTPNGLPLTTFNGSGFLTISYPDGSAVASGIAFDSVDRLVLSGTTKSAEDGSSASLWRYFASGAFDGSLPGSGGTGLARFDVRNGSAGTSASAVVVLPEGSAFATGSAFDRESGAIDLMVWKLRP